MSQPKNTPGPWKEIGRQESMVHGATIYVGEHGCGIVVAKVQGPNVEADARLVAAAPDLAAALRQALDESGCDGDLCAHDWHDAARAALAKVEP